MNKTDMKLIREMRKVYEMSMAARRDNQTRHAEILFSFYQDLHRRAVASGVLFINSSVPADKFESEIGLPDWTPQVIHLEGAEAEAAANAKRFTDTPPSVHAGAVARDSRVLKPGEIEVRICGEDGTTKCWRLTADSHRGVILHELFTMGDGYK